MTAPNTISFPPPPAVLQKREDNVTARKDERIVSNAPLQQQTDSVTQQQDHFLTFENDWLHPFLCPEEDPLSCFFLDSGADPPKCTDHASAGSCGQKVPLQWSLTHVLQVFENF